MAQATRKGVFCLEGAWERRLDDRTSVLPTLELIDRLECGRFIHRDVGTEEELRHYLAKWAQRGYDSYEVLYLAFHGSAGAIQIGRRTVSLDEVAEYLGRTVEGRIVYFGSCSVLRDRRAIEEFRERTGARLVCGYRKEVDWVESSAFDVLLLSSLLENNRIDARVNALRRKYPDLVKILGFTTYPTFERRSAPVR